MATPRQFTTRRAPELKNFDDVRNWVEAELEALTKSTTVVSILQLIPTHAAVEKPRIGMVVFADGSDWNPGAGEGTYEYTSGGWIKL